MNNYYKNLIQNFATIIPYVSEFNILNLYSSFNGHPLRDKDKHKKLKKRMIKYIEKCLVEDARICNELGFKRNLPNLKSIKDHFSSLKSVLIDYKSILKRRSLNDLDTGSKRRYPKYFNRNFHFQTDGYTSTHSAKIYDHQVEMLFAGLASPMRRLILEEIKDFKNSEILELACGTGSGTEIVSRFLPNSYITATDMSHEYIQYAKDSRKLVNVNFTQMDATKIDKKFDCIYHIFLLHELPTRERNLVLKHN